MAPQPEVTQPRIVESFMKPEPINCRDVCGEPKCTKVGQPTKNGHVKGCSCISCRNRNNRKRGLAKQSRAARTLGLVTGKFAPSDEENMGGHLLFEHKATAREAGPVATAYERCRAQAMAAKSIGDTRPFAAGFTPPGSTHTYLTVRDDDLEAFVLADAYVRGFIRD